MRDISIAIPNFLSAPERLRLSFLSPLREIGPLWMCPVLPNRGFVSKSSRSELQVFPQPSSLDQMFLILSSSDPHRHTVLHNFVLLERMLSEPLE